VTPPDVSDSPVEAIVAALRETYDYIREPVSWADAERIQQAIRDAGFVILPTQGAGKPFCGECHAWRGARP
jgi:hypothetical protein